jgi:serine O-acetyltransferase
MRDVAVASRGSLLAKIVARGSILHQDSDLDLMNADTVMKLWQIIRADLYRYCGETSGRAFLAAYLKFPGFRFTFYMRKVAFYSASKRSFGLLAYIYNRLWLNHYRFRYGFEISPTTEIGPGLYIGHFGGVVISPFATLGSNVNIAQGVTIGAASRGARRGAPVLGNRVWVGAHAIIVGRVTIGDDALIGPGAYVNFDVPEKSIVLGNPGKIVSTSGSAGYVNNVFEASDSSKL